VLRERLSDVIEDATNDIASIARLVIQRAQEHWRELDQHIDWCDQRISAHNKDDEAVQRASKLQGIGPITASALVATVGDFKHFRNGAQFGAWLGLTPRQDSSGGKTTLGGITKRGDMYLRMLLIQAARSAVMSADRRSDPISKWVQRLRERSGWQVAAVALANKNARILWAVMSKGRDFDPHHVSVQPGRPAMAA
jgi:transposase